VRATGVLHGSNVSIAAPAGEMKSTKIARFLNQFYSGKVCASAVKIGARRSMSWSDRKSVV